MKPATLILTIVVALAFASPAFSAKQQENYRYFFLTPPNNVGNLVIIGINTTTFRIYNLSKGGLEKTLFMEDTVSRMEMKIIKGFQPGYYLITSEKRLSVIVDFGTVWRWLGTYYPATTGGYVGKEFICTSFPQREVAPTIAFFEDAKVIIYNSKGKKLLELSGWQNETKILGLPSGEPFRIVSTGRIAVSQMEDNGGYFLVNERGVFRGRQFFGVMYSQTLVIPYEPCKVEIYEMKKGSKIGEHTFTKSDVENNRLWLFYHSYIGPVKIVSTGDITVMFTASGSLGTALERIQDSKGCYLAYVQPGVVFRFYSIKGGAIFTPFATTLNVDGNDVTMAAGQYMDLSPDHVYEIKADQPVIVVTYNDMVADGYYLVSDKDIGEILPPPKPSEKGKGGGGLGIPMEALIGGVVAIAVVAVLYLRTRKKRI